MELRKRLHEPIAKTAASTAACPRRRRLQLRLSA
jgi:hypothetical protein